MEIFVVTKAWNLTWSDFGTCTKNVIAFTNKKDTLEYIKKRTLHDILMKYGHKYYKTISKINWDYDEKRYRIYNDENHSWFAPDMILSIYSYNVIPLVNKKKLKQIKNILIHK